MYGRTNHMATMLFVTLCDASCFSCDGVLDSSGAFTEVGSDPSLLLLPSLAYTAAIGEMTISLTGDLSLFQKKNQNDNALK